MITFIIVFFIIGIFIAGTSSRIFLSKYEQYDSIESSSNCTGLDYIINAIKYYKLNVKVSITDKKLNDGYSIKHKVIVLSQDVANSKSLASITVASHELGHAMQHKEKNALLILDYLFSKFNKFASFLLLPLFLSSLILLFIPKAVSIATIFLFVCGGIICFSIFVRIITVPLEINASNRALDLLKKHSNFSKKEISMAKKLLKSAGLTYIGSIFYELWNILKFLFSPLTK